MDTKGIVIEHELQANTDIVFSMRPKVETYDSGVHNVNGADIITIYGVIGNQQILDTMVWTLTYTTDTDSEIAGDSIIHTFTLSYTSNGTTYYLAENDEQTGLNIVTDPSAASEFYCDQAGEIRIHGDFYKRVTIDASGNLILESTSDMLREDNLHFYTLSEGHTALYEWTITNLEAIELPNTGGTGTWIFTVAGVCLIGSTASALLYRKRRAVKS